jgi:hypothetical protein
VPELLLDELRLVGHPGVQFSQEVFQRCALPLMMRTHHGKDALDDLSRFPVRPEGVIGVCAQPFGHQQGQCLTDIGGVPLCGHKERQPSQGCSKVVMQPLPFTGAVVFLFLSFVAESTTY